jgi:hypothetical protein
MVRCEILRIRDMKFPTNAVVSGQRSSNESRMSQSLVQFAFSVRSLASKKVLPDSIELPGTAYPYRERVALLSR